MFEFKNEINAEALHECMGQFGSLFKKGYIVRGIVVAVIFSFLLFVVCGADIISLAVEAGLIVYCIFMSKFAYKNQVKVSERNINRAAEENGMQNTSCNGTINGNTITINKGTETKTISLNDILSTIETPNYFMVIMKGKYCMVISKASIKGGSVDEFRNRINKYTPGKKYGNMKYIETHLQTI